MRPVVARIAIGAASTVAPTPRASGCPMPRWPPLIFSPPPFTATGTTPSGHDSPQTDAVVRAQALSGDVALQHGQEPFAVGRVARFDHQVEDQAAFAGGQVELVTVINVAAALDDDVGMRLEQADQLVAGGHRLAGEHPPLALRDHPLDQRLIVTDLGLPEGDRWAARP